MVYGAISKLLVVNKKRATITAVTQGRTIFPYTRELSINHREYIILFSSFFSGESVEYKDDLWQAGVRIECFHSSRHFLKFSRCGSPFHDHRHVCL